MTFDKLEITMSKSCDADSTALTAPAMVIAKQFFGLEEVVRELSLRDVHDLLSIVHGICVARFALEPMKFEIRENGPLEVFLEVDPNLALAGLDLDDKISSTNFELIDDNVNVFQAAPIACQVARVYGQLTSTDLHTVVTSPRSPWGMHIENGELGGTMRPEVFQAYYRQSHVELAGNLEGFARRELGNANSSL